MADPIRTALMAARACIQQDRQALADAHTSVDGLDADGAAGVAEYDEVLRQLEEALGALAAPGEEREAFKAWYVLKAFDYARDPIGSRDYALQWAAWQARAMLAALHSAPTAALTEKQVDAGVYAVCPDFDAAHEGPSIDDVRAIALAAIAKFCEVNGLAAPEEGKEGGA